MQYPAHSLKFCGAWARVFCVVLAYVASHVTFRGYFESTHNTVQSFSRAKDSSLGRFLFMIVTPCCKYCKTNVWMDIFKFNRYTSLKLHLYCSKSNVKFLQLTSSELHQELLKLSGIVSCFKVLCYFWIIFVVLVELEVASDLTTISENFSSQIFYTTTIV